MDTQAVVEYRNTLQYPGTPPALKLDEDYSRNLGTLNVSGKESGIDPRVILQEQKVSNAPVAEPVAESQPTKEQQAPEEQYFFPLDEVESASSRHKSMALAIDSYIADSVSRLPREYHESVMKLLEKKRNSILDIYDPSKSSKYVSNDFLKEAAIDTRKDVSKYNNAASSVSSLISMLEQQKPKDLSDSEWTQVLATKMDAMAKVVNQAMTGTPDAVAVEEAKRINPEMSTRLANLQNMFRPGYDVFRPQNLERAKNMLYDLYNLNISRSNAAYNSLAKSSNPEYAASRLPQIFKPVVREGVLPAIERISRKSKQSTYSPEASNQNTQAQKLNSPIGKPNRVVIGGR